MDESSAWLPCLHEWVDITELSDDEYQWVCDLCGERSQGEAVEHNSNRGGWRTIKTYISAEEEMVKMRVVEEESGRTVYAAAYQPEVARQLAYSLTLKALEIEDA